MNEPYIIDWNTVCEEKKSEAHANSVSGVRGTRIVWYTPTLVEYEIESEGISLI